MNFSDDPNTDKSHNSRAGAWKGIFTVYGLLLVALLWNWLS